MTDEILHVSPKKGDKFQHLRKYNHQTATKQKYMNIDDYPSVYKTLQQTSEER